MRWLKGGGPKKKNPSYQPKNTTQVPNPPAIPSAPANQLVVAVPPTQHWVDNISTQYTEVAIVPSNSKTAMTTLNPTNIQLPKIGVANLVVKDPNFVTLKNVNGSTEVTYTNNIIVSYDSANVPFYLMSKGVKEYVHLAGRWYKVLHTKGNGMCYF